MKSINCLYLKTYVVDSRIYGGEATVYKFIKDKHNLVEFDRENLELKYHYPVSFIRTYGEDEAISVTPYHRYHDYICSDNKDCDFAKMLPMYNIYWELNEEYCSLIKKSGEDLSRRYKSINRIIIEHFQSNDYKNFSAEYIKDFIYKELMEELYLRIQWEESKLLDIVKSIRSQNKDIDVNKWKLKYIERENKFRSQWYNFIINIVKMSLGRITDFVDEKTVRKIMSINIDEFKIPINDSEIYDDDKYNYLFTINLNKIVLTDGLWVIMDSFKGNNVLITTANIKMENIVTISFKDIITDFEPNINNVPVKKSFPRREKQMMDKFGYDVERSPLEMEKSKKAFTDMILADLNTPKSTREKNREKYLTNLSKDKTATDNTNSYVSKYTGPYVSKNTNTNSVKSSNKNINYDTKQYSTTNTNTNTKIKSEKDDTRRDKIFSDKVFDIPSYMDMTRYEQVDQNKMLELKNNFVFNTVFSLGKYYMMSSTLNTISKYYKICNEKGKMLKEYISELYNKISFDDMKN